MIRVLDNPHAIACGTPDDVSARLAPTPRRERWPPFVIATVDGLVAAHRAAPPTVLSMAEEAGSVLRAAAAEGAFPGPVPTVGTLWHMVAARMPAADGPAHKACEAHPFGDRPLRRVAVGRTSLPGIPAMGWHLVVARDDFSGMIVAAGLLPTAEVGVDFLDLFDGRGASRPSLHPVRRCEGLPERLAVVDAGPVAAGLRDAAAALGVRVEAGREVRLAFLGDVGCRLKAIADEPWSPEDVAGYLQALLAVHDRRRLKSGKIVRERWEEGVARCPPRTRATLADDAAAS